MTKTETVLAGAILLGGVGLGLLASSVAFIRRHVTAEPAAADVAAHELDREVARFAGKQPLREIRDGQTSLPGGSWQPSANRGRRLHALISDVRSNRLVRVDIPLAVLRVAKRGADHAHASGARILMWVE